MAQIGRSQSHYAKQSFVVLAHQVLSGVEVIPEVSAKHRPYGQGRRKMKSTGGLPDYCMNRTQRY